jgi:hypothetical protein
MDCKGVEERPLRRGVRKELEVKEIDEVKGKKGVEGRANRVLGRGCCRLITTHASMNYNSCQVIL